MHIEVNIPALATLAVEIAGGVPKLYDAKPKQVE